MSYTPPLSPLVSTSNSTAVALADGATYTGTWEDVSRYASISIACTVAPSGAVGTLYADFSPDGTNVDSTRSWPVTDGTVGTPRMLSPTRQWFRVRYVDTAGTAQSAMRIQTMLQPWPRMSLPTSAMVQDATDHTDIINTRAILVGQLDSGRYTTSRMTQEGHLEMAIRAPLTAFRDVRVASLRPQWQHSFPYGVQADEWNTFTGGTGAAITTASGAATAASGTSSTGYAVLRTRRRLTYRPGVGGLVRFTAAFGTGAANSLQIAGPGTVESGYFVGYNGTSFGFLHRKGGLREIRTLTVTVGSGGSATATVTLNGVAKTVAITSGSTAHNAAEIAAADYSATGDGWDTDLVGSTVIFLSRTAASLGGAYSLSVSAGTLAGTFATTRAGATPTDNWTAQASWSGDVFDGTGSTSNPSGALLDPTKGNVYAISYQYLGFGPQFLGIEVEADDGNNPDLITAHVNPYLNANTTPSVANPSAPFRVESRNLGATTSQGIICGSAAGFSEGEIITAGANPVQTASSSSVGTTEIPILTIRAPRTYAGVTSQVGVVAHAITMSVKPQSASVIVTIRARRDATLTYPVYARPSASHAALVDTSATATTGGEIRMSYTFVDTAAVSIPLNGQAIELEPGQSLTLTAQASSGSSSLVAVSVSCAEWQ